MSVTLHLPPATEKLLQEQAAGRGQTVEAFLQQLIERGLQLTNGNIGQAQPESEPWREQLLDELRHEIDIGIAQADAGDVAPFSARAELARILQQKAETRESA